MVGKILVVDDEDTLRLTIKTRLAAGGFEADAAIDGEEALQKLKEKKYDVVLLDINMPRMDGIAALGAITEMNPDIDVIMLTGFADFTTAIECLKKGARDYLVKPIDTTELITRLRSLLRARTSEAALESERRKQNAFIFDAMVDPLAALTGVLKAMAKSGLGKTPKDQAAILAQLDGVVETMIKLGKDAVNPSLLTLDSVRLDLGEVSIEKLLEPLVDRATVLGKLEDVEVKSTLDAKLPKIHADATTLAAGVWSAIAAVLAVSSHGASLSINASKQNGDGGEELRLEILSTKVTERTRMITELASKPFESLGSSASGVEDPVLLLQAAKRMISAHRGNVQAEFSKGDGMKVRCTIPFK